jgi:cobalt/nickel transport system permease protein
MHVPDGLLSAPVAVACAALAGAAVAAAAALARARLGSRAVATMGVTAAFTFSAQMINFPVAGGTSGHIVGGVLAAVLLGPSAAVVVMTAVLVLQCLIFGDGGLLALGANVLNMAVIHPIAGYAVYRLVLGRVGKGRLRPGRQVAATAFGSWAATVMAAATCAGELALSGVVAPGVVLPAMVGVHAVIGLGESVTSALVIAAVIRLRPGLVASPVGVSPRVSVDVGEGKRSGAVVRSGAGARVGAGVVLGLVPSLGVALFLSPFACRWPDGLERVVEHLGIEPSRSRIVGAPLRDYVIPGIEGSFWTTGLAAVAGTLLVFALSCALGAWLVLPSSRSAS